MSETCATCRFFQHDEHGDGGGNCRRAPPVWAASPETGPGWAMPYVDGRGCGEHRPSASPAEPDEYTRAAVRYAEVRMAIQCARSAAEVAILGNEHWESNDAFLRLYREKHGG